VVVDVAPLLHLGRDGAPALAAGQQPREREVPPHHLGDIALLGDLLHLLEQVLGDERWVCAVIPLAVPDVLAVVERILEHEFQIRMVEPLTLTCPQSFLIPNGFKVSEGVIPAGPQLPQPLDERGAFRVEVNQLRLRIVQIAERGD